MLTTLELVRYFEVQYDGERRQEWYAFRSVSDTEKCYPVIDQKGFVRTWASEKLFDYVLGTPFHPTNRLQTA